MNAWFAGTSSPVPATPSGPRVRSGSSALSGMNTVEPLLTVWSTPWSKNWPKNVNTLLNGGDKPTSVVMFGMNSVLCSGVQPTGVFGAVQTTAVGVGSCDRTGDPAAEMAAGLVEVWSSIRLLTVRGCESATLPVFCLYDEATGPPNNDASSASLNTGEVRRGNTWSDAAKFLVVASLRLLQEPSTERRPYDVRMSGTCSASGIGSPGWARSVPHGLDAVSVVACRSAILICLRMNDRSPAETVNPLPTGAKTARAAVIATSPCMAKAAAMTASSFVSRVGRRPSAARRPSRLARLRERMAFVGRVGCAKNRFMTSLPRKRDRERPPPSRERLGKTLWGCQGRRAGSRCSASTGQAAAARRA